MRIPNSLGVATTLLTLALATPAVAASSASAASPWWQLNSLSEPSNLSPGDSGTLVLSASNLGDAEVSGSGATVALRDTLPPGLRAISASGITTTGPSVRNESRGKVLCKVLSGSLVECTFTGKLPPYEQLQATIEVQVLASASSGESNEVTISGGGAVATSLKRPLLLSSAPTQFGVENYELTAFNENGSLDTQAGSHPFGLTTTLDLNRTAEAGYQPALPKDLNFNLPPGLIGDPTPFPQCSDAQFEAPLSGFKNACPANTALGVVSITVYEPLLQKEPLTVLSPVFNLKPAVGEPARFGFETLTAHVVLDTSVRTGGDYGVSVSVSNITQIASFLSSQLTFWGVPGDPSHDQSRGWECIGGGAYQTKESGLAPCNPQAQTAPPPFLSLPTSCTGPLQTTMQADTWAQEGSFTAPLAPTFEPSLDGCNRLSFEPEIKVAPDGQEASKPTGLSVDVHVPQEVNENAEGLASSNVKDIKVVFPEGVVVNPAAADGLQACPESEIGLEPGLGEQGEFLFSPTLPEPFCPDASKIGTVTIKSPLLPKGQDVAGSLYLATPAPNGEVGQNPFNSLIATYIVAKDPVSGTLVKLPGSVSLNETTGQITATFANNPQLAFEDAEIHLFGGERAPFATPSHCGTYTTEATFTPWSGNPPVTSQSSFQITSACPPAALSFSPSLAAGTTNNNAGGFSPLSTTISREDGNQNIDKVQLHMPPGLSGILTGVPLCPEAQANAGTCSQASEIGKTIVSVGLGGDPFTVVGGEVFLTEKITGSPQDAPFGLSIVNPAVAGPFNLGKVVVRATIEVDPHTAQLTVTTTEIPHILRGIPLQIKHVNVTIDRSGFTFNPTNCIPQQVTGTIGSVEGSSSGVAVPFQATNCASLKFGPKFAVSTQGKTSKAEGASLSVKLTYPSAPFGSQANIARVKVDLPRQLPSRLTTLQKACTNAQFEANPAGCPAASVIGHAKATTPLIPVPLEGPAYFVSHGGEAFPSLIIVLQGYGVKLNLVGTTFISKAGITSSTFKTVPDAPVGSFELTLPEGPYSALAANGNLCTSKLTMPTEFLAQNGAVIKGLSTPVSVTGCPKVKALTRAQKLAAALKACNKKAKQKRAACRASARKKYGPVKTKKKSKGKKGA